MKETLPLQGFRFHDAPIKWELAPVDYQMISLGNLLKRFYGTFDKDIESYRPLAFVRNPTQRNGEPAYVNDVIVVPYRRNFRIVIEKEGIFGPHATYLYYSSEQLAGEVAWVATLQITGMYYDDQVILDELTCAIRLRQLYHSEKSAEQIVIK